MKQNVTVAFDRDLIAEARKLAAEEKTTLNGLLRDLLKERVRVQAERREAIRHMIELSRSSQSRMDMSSWSRDDIYADRMDRIGS